MLGFDEFVTAATNRRRLLTGKGNLRYAFDLIKDKESDTMSLEAIKAKFSDGNLGTGQEVK